MWSEKMKLVYKKMRGWFCDQGTSPRNISVLI